MSAYPPDAIVAGHICLDIIPEFSGQAAVRLETLFAPGHMTVVGPAALSTGGPVSNTGLALNRLGIRTQLMGKIGPDLFGQAVQQIVQAYAPGQEAGLVIDPRASTSYTVIINPPGVDRIFLHHSGANDTFHAGDVQYSAVSQARLFHFGYPPIMRRMYADGGEQLAELFRRARALGVTTSLDMTFPDPASPGGQADWRAILSTALPHVDIFLPSLEELLFLLHRAEYEALRRQGGGLLDGLQPGRLSRLSQEILDMGVKIVVFKLGSRGLYLRCARAGRLASMGRGGPQDLQAWSGRELWAPCFRVNVAGTTGAGDATIAGFISALLRGLSPEEAVTAAVAVGACNVEAPDALSGLRGWEETLQRIRSGWERLPLHLEAPGWSFDANLQLWKAEYAG